MKTVDAQSPVQPPDPFVGEGGASTPVRSDRDPYEALDDLMTVVEALCPKWPERGTFSSNSRSLL